MSFDATDKSLYSFNERQSMTKFREASAVMAVDRFFSLADSDTAKFVIHATEKIPYVKKIFDSLKGQPEIVVKLSDEAKKKLESGEWHWVFSQDGSGILPTLKDEANQFAKQVRLGEKVIRPDMLNSLIDMSQKKNLDALMDKIIYLTDVVEKISAGQYNDRVAMFYGARQLYIEAMSMNDPENKKIALLNAAKSSADAISTLQQTIRYDLNTLPLLKSSKRLEESTKLIAKCFSKLNDSVQIAVNVYAALGENHALLAAITSYQCFIEQTLLAVPEKVPDKKYSGCSLADIMHSCAEIDDINWRLIPSEIITDCEEIVDTERKTMVLLSDTFKPQLSGGTENEL